MKEYSLTAIGRTTKKALICAIKTTGYTYTAGAIVETVRDVLLKTVYGVSQIAKALDKGIADIIKGAVYINSPSFLGYHKCIELKGRGKCLIRQENHQSFRKIFKDVNRT